MNDQTEILKALIDAQAHLDALVRRSRQIQDRLEGDEFCTFESQVTRAKAAAARAKEAIDVHSGQS